MDGGPSSGRYPPCLYRCYPSTRLVVTTVGQCFPLPTLPSVSSPSLRRTTTYHPPYLCHKPGVELSSHLKIVPYYFFQVNPVFCDILVFSTTVLLRPHKSRSHSMNPTITTYFFSDLTRPNGFTTDRPDSFDPPTPSPPIG